MRNMRLIQISALCAKRVMIAELTEDYMSWYVVGGIFTTSSVYYYQD